MGLGRPRKASPADSGNPLGGRAEQVSLGSEVTRSRPAHPCTPAIAANSLALVDSAFQKVLKYRLATRKAVLERRKKKKEAAKEQERSLHAAMSGGT